MMKRMCWWGRIKPDKIEEYKESHRVVWPELLAVYKKHGIVKISCFLKGNDLLVYTEYDPEIYLKGGKEAIGKKRSRNAGRPGCLSSRCRVSPPSSSRKCSGWSSRGRTGVSRDRPERPQPPVASFSPCSRCPPRASNRPRFGQT